MEELENMEDLENVEELVNEGTTSSDLLVRSSAGGVARVTILVPAIVPVSDLLSLMPLVPFSKLLFRAVRVSLRFSTTWTDHDMHRPKLLVRLIRSTALR